MKYRHKLTCRQLSKSILFISQLTIYQSRCLIDQIKFKQTITELEVKLTLLICLQLIRTDISLTVYQMKAHQSTFTDCQDPNHSKETLGKFKMKNKIQWASVKCCVATKNHNYLILIGSDAIYHQLNSQGQSLTI